MERGQIKMPTETTYYMVVDGIIYAKGTFEEMQERLKKECGYFDILERHNGTKPDIMPSDLYYRCLYAGVYME